MFDGDSFREPVISEVILKTGLAVNILSADVKQLSGKRYGQMLLDMPEAYEDRARLVEALRAQGVTVEEVHLS